MEEKKNQQYEYKNITQKVTPGVKELLDRHKAKKEKDECANPKDSRKIASGQALLEKWFEEGIVSKCSCGIIELY